MLFACGTNRIDILHQTIMHFAFAFPFRHILAKLFPILMARAAAPFAIMPHSLREC